MGQVYLAEDPLARRRVALKVMKPHVAGVPGARERFLREIRAAAQVEHDHVVPIWQPGEDNGILYFAMPFLQGETLEGRMRRERSPLALAVKVGREVAEGLAAVHDRGLIHRDVKPSNIWLEGESGVVRRAKVLDFGLARIEESGDHSTFGFVLGTPPYMSPEQAAGDRLDARSDLFGLGVVLYRLLTGELPFEVTSAACVRSVVMGRKPAPPRVRAPEVPAALSDLVLRLLAADPANRPGSAHEVAAALAAIERDLPAGPSFDDASTAMVPQ